MKWAWIGIDPGKSDNGLGVIRGDGQGVQRITSVGMPEDEGGQIDAIRGLIGQLGAEGVESIQVIIEQINAMPTDGNRQAFTFGRFYQLARTVIRCLDLPLHEVSPSAWKRRIFGTVSYPEGMTRAQRRAAGKKAAVERAHQWFPGAEMQGPHKPGQAEAILLAWYGRREFDLGAAAGEAP